jgi:hypothetical protein
MSNLSLSIFFDLGSCSRFVTLFVFVSSSIGSCWNELWTCHFKVWFISQISLFCHVTSYYLINRILIMIL